MGALPGWGPRCWHPVPEANTLRLALCLLLVGSPQRTPAQPACREEEFPVGLECCPKCGPGFHVRRVCSEMTGTECSPCPSGTYTAHPNGLRQCLRCQDCEPGMGLVTRRKCSSTQDTVCDCSQGHFCKAQEGDRCVLCEPHATCHPGQRVKERGRAVEDEAQRAEAARSGIPSSTCLVPAFCPPPLSPGTSSQDTLCADCPPGTFSPNGTLDQCLPWSRCSGWFQREVEPSTSSEDVTCAMSGLAIGLCMMVLIFLLTVLSLVIWIWKKRKRSLGFGASMTNVAQQGQQRGGAEKLEVTEALQSCPDVTTVAVEETAMFGENDPHR